MEEIYLITVFQKMKLTENGLVDLGYHRCVGWFNNEGEARNAVENNFSNMQDNLYNYAVIEKMMSGIKIPETSKSFYEFKNKRFVEIDTPEILKGFSNFSIG